MNRRTFFLSAGAGGLASGIAVRADETSVESVPHDGPALGGAPVITGPAPEHMVILQPLRRPATGFVEFAVGDAEFQRVDADVGGLHPYESHVLKFRLPPLPTGKAVRYRVTLRSIDWVRVKQWVHGKIVAGDPEPGVERTFRTLDPGAATSSFVVWNDTHENSETLKALHESTSALNPDFLLWNGDQTNDVHFESEMAGQYLAPEGLPITDRWPLAYVRGNHDLRGPAARKLPSFTGTPDDRFYYSFRSGPLAALVMDTGEDKPDDSPYFAGLAAFKRMRQRQADWLKATITQPWFREAPFRILFCHIPLWWVRDRTDIDWWEFSKVCRDAWAPTLQEAGVELVISGHTHSHTWMPASPEQPLAQLIGGGPQPHQATLIHGIATSDRLSLKMQKLDGTLLQEIVLPAPA
ncbi:MAG: metallophosphoesterase [Verrucomicrobiae bacterium]|nr:metallophosphoesterase [Verrucomicrobiae bacterium]